MQYDFDTPIDRTGTCSEKWEKYRNMDIIPMWVADMDFKVPEPILEALEQRLSHPVFGYSAIPAQLYRTVADYVDKYYGWTIDPDWIVWCPGIVSALNVACRGLVDPDQSIVTTVPVYPPFLAAPKNAGRRLVTVPMIEENNRMVFDKAGLEAALSDNAGLFILCSPCNPCGTVFTESELATLIGLCQKYDVALCSDEIHCDFILDETRSHIPAASLEAARRLKIITLMAPSKTFNIPGLSCSFAVIEDIGLRKRFCRASAGIVPGVNVFGITAAQAAYSQCSDWLAGLIDYLRNNRDMVVSRVNGFKGCRVLPIEATYLAWIDVRKTGISNPVQFFEKAGVGLSDGEAFGQKGFVRLNFGCPVSRLKQGLDRMETALSL